MTRQEMFTRAVVGLRNQGFRQARMPDPEPTGFEEDETVCAYLAANGDRCAWGHVDPIEDLVGVNGSVLKLHNDGIGIAADLDDDGLLFANRLQLAHDRGYTPTEMEEKLRKVGVDYNLEWPA